MDTSAIDNLIGQLRSAAAAAGNQPVRSTVKSAATPDFASMLQASLDAVNGAQLDATRLARGFELGSSNANLSDVMISMQKANLSFQQMVQVRNRLVAAYNEIMNMQL